MADVPVSRLTVWKILRLWAPVAAYMALLFALSSREHIVSMPSNWDKVVHTAAYFVLGALALRACHDDLRRLALRPAIGAVVLTAGYALIDELQQSRVAGRHASVLDWLADLLGAALAVACVGLLSALRTRSARTALARTVASSLISRASSWVPSTDSTLSSSGSQPKNPAQKS